MVDGDGSISYTRDEGRTITPTAVRQRPVQYIFTVVPLPRANTMRGVDSCGSLQVSADAGCSWTAFGQVKGLDAPRLTGGHDDQAYLWDQNGLALYRVDGRQVTPLPAIAKDDTSSIGVAALAVNRYLPWHVRAVLSDGTIRDSYDTGRSWNHSTGLGKPGDVVNAFSVAVSPVNPQVVWAQGINIAENDAHAPSEGRHIYRSTDGGRTFRVAVDHKPGQVTLVNGALLAPSPTDENVLYFIFGTSFARYGTDLFRFDARHNELSVQHNSHDGIKSISFNPGEEKVMYLGFAAELG
ncbi:sialidase family protein [Actinocrispum wychmicini]|uniref:sialidase family protein n=1 Tax=Actinocrispum wychmicini TaxID=1213861 RepID=UPI001046EB4C|nr:sialidase family protein [Actinocrispum wychmicini]